MSVWAWSWDSFGALLRSSASSVGAYTRCSVGVLHSFLAGNVVSAWSWSIVGAQLFGLGLSSFAP